MRSGWLVPIQNLLRLPLNVSSVLSAVSWGLSRQAGATPIRKVGACSLRFWMGTSCRLTHDCLLKRGKVRLSSKSHAPAAYGAERVD